MPRTCAKTQSVKSPGSFTLIEGIIVTVVLILFVVAVLSVMHKRQTDKERLYCRGNLPAIGLGLLMYTGDNGGWFPILGTPGTRNFEPLNSGDTLADGRVYACPAISGKQPRTAANSDYLYVGSGLKDDNAYAGEVRLAFDASGNHRWNSWINVLFIDGHAEGARPDGKKGWNTYDFPTSPDPAGIVPPTTTP